MMRISDAMRAANVSYSHMWGFDSFQGLPEELNVDYAKVLPGDYKQGRYNSQDYFGSSSHQLLSQLERRIDDPRVRWVRGFYNDTCTPETLRMLPFSPALYVDLDCDLYSSTYQALDWMFTSKLIVPGTIIGYDDWIHGGSGGQEKVHADIGAKHGVKFLVRGPNSRPAFHPLPFKHGDDLRCWKVAT